MDRKEYFKEYYMKNKDKLLEYHREYSKSYRKTKAYRESWKKSYEKNKEKTLKRHRKYKRRYYKTDRGKLIKKNGSKRFYDRNKDLYNAYYNLKYHNRKKNIQSLPKMKTEYWKNNKKMRVNMRSNENDQI